MVYRNHDISPALASGQLIIEPTPTTNMLATASVDLSLGNTFNIFDARRPEPKLR